MLSKFTPVQDSSKFATLKKPAKVAIVRQQPSLDREMRGPIADPIYKYSSLTLPSGIVQPQIGPGGPLRYPFYRVQSPQTPRQNSVPNSPCCPNGPLPRVSGRMPQQPLQQRTSALPYATTANTLSCVATPITQRQARYLRKEVKQPTRQSAVPDEAAKTPSSSSSSRDSGIMSQDSSSSIQSFCIEDYNQSNPGGFRTPQCVPRRAKQVTRKTVVEAPAVKYRSGGGTLNRPKVTKSAIATTRLSTGPSTSCTSSPATPRASWNSSPAVVEGEQLKAANKVSRATSVCATGLEHQRRGPSKQVTAGQLASPNGKIPRPTNLAGDKGSRMDKDIGWFAGKIQSFKPEENASSERPSRNSSLPSGSDRCPATGSSHIPTPRAKTLSPPPQFASSSFSTPSTKTPKSPFSLSHPINSLTPDSSSTSTCTLAANPKGSSPSLAGTTTATGCANLDDTPTPSNRSSPEPRPPLASTPSVPLVVVDGKVQEFDKPAMTAPPSPRSPRLSPRLGGAGEDQSFGCSGCGPLSHFKLPYSTPVMQRMQHQQQAGISSSFGKRPLGAEGGGGLAKTPTCASNSNQPISEAFGSYMSLSSSGSVMSAANDSAAFEVAKLRRELELAHQKVAALTCQLSANASVVQAFEQSLQSLNQRLHQLSASSAIKEREVQELRKIIDRFRCQAALNDWPSILENARDGKKLSQSQEFVKPHHIIETDVMQQAGSLSSLVQSPHSVTGYPEINRYIQEVTPRGYMSPSYMPIRDSFERNSKKGGWVS
uniref:Serine/arginine repetitive matrix protein 2-like n=1 Tax=Mesocestoides corti TaxID=53468 RepID=A0A5K3FPW2_MESCO